MTETDNVDVASDATEAPVSERPEWLPEKFKTPEDLVTSYTSLESKLGQDESKMREAFMAEIEKEAMANRPATVGDYQVPEIVDETMAVDNPLFQWWANHSFENGYSQEEFEAGIQQYSEFFNSMQPDLEAERAKLGENANARIEAVDLWANKFFPDSMADAVLTIGQTAAGIEALEHIMRQVSDPSVTADVSSVSNVNENDLRAMMQDPRYWNPAKREPNFVKQVEDGFSKLYRG
jgi:hypothetical protein